MTKLYLVRHGQAAAGWAEDLDPGLSDEGRRQAEAMADELAPLGPLPIVTSPLRRTRETAEPLARRWAVTPRVDPAVGEIPAADLTLAERGTWLADLFATPPDEWAPALQQWRAAIRDTLTRMTTDTVVVTHFVFITQAVGDPNCRPGHCSVTVLDLDAVAARP